MIIELRRETLSPTTPTLGTLWMDGEHAADSLELPWLENMRKVSCIRAGRYELAYYVSARFKKPLIHVEGVPGRSGILIHPGNEAKDSLGCILLGKRTSPTRIDESREAVGFVTARVRAALAVNPVWLLIKDPEVAA